VIALADDVRRFLDGANFAHLATVMPDGAPHAVPVWVGLEGDRIAFLTHPRSRKARNLAADPRVAISITERDRPNAMAHIRGRVVEVLDGDEAWIVIDRLSGKYLGGPYPERVDRVVFLIEPEHAWAQTFG
jgi:PPOX class probable F420-dependent enzyme